MLNRKAFTKKKVLLRRYITNVLYFVQPIGTVENKQQFQLLCKRTTSDSLILIQANIQQSFI